MMPMPIKLAVRAVNRNRPPTCRAVVQCRIMKRAKRVHGSVKVSAPIVKASAAQARAGAVNRGNQLKLVAGVISKSNAAIASH